MKCVHETATAGRQLNKRRECLLLAHHVISRHRSKRSLLGAYPLWGETRMPDGKVEGTYIIGRTLTFSLSGLASAHFDKGLTMLFEFSHHQLPIRKVLATASEGNWIELPPPPTKEDVSNLFIDQKQRNEQYERIFSDWQRKIIALGRRAGNHGDLLDEFEFKTNWDTGQTTMSIVLNQSSELGDTLKRLIAKCQR